MAKLTIKGEIHIIGLGVDEQASLGEAAQSALSQAELIIGSQRQLKTIGHLLPAQPHAELMELPKLKQLASLLSDMGSRCVVVLASGDPLYYGIGRWFSQQVPAESLHFYPAVSSIQAACHRLGLSLQDVEVVSLHGRALSTIRTKLHRNRYLVILTDQYSQPQTLAKECIAAGFNLSSISVCENLGYSTERVRHFTVSELVDKPALDFDPLHVSVIALKGCGGVLPEFPGIPDEHYLTGREPGKGMISKRETRLVILSFLQASEGDVIWDIGAGCGGVAVELAYWAPGASIYAIECHDERLEYLQANRERFGVTQNLMVVAGLAPSALDGLPAPNKVFIGGSNGELGLLLETAWRALPPGGVLVASAVMERSKAELHAFVKALGQEVALESVVLSVERGHIADDPAASLEYVAKLPVEIMKLTKRACLK